MQGPTCIKSSSFHRNISTNYPVCCSLQRRISIYCKGFGSNEKKNKASNKSAKPQKAVTLKQGSPQIKKILEEVEKGKLNIDPEVAAKGKVDFVRVESWGNASDPESQLENLKMKSFSPSFTSLDQEAPFYEQIVRRLQLFEAKGDIKIVQAKPLPPFERWLFREHNYLQFLVDQLEVYTALENAVSSVEQERCRTEDKSSSSGPAAMAVSIFGKNLGLNRSEVLNADIQSLYSVMTSKSVEQNAELPKSTTQAVAYAKYVDRLGRIAAFEQNGKEGCLRLLSHVFSIHVSHLTTGMRIGAKAVDSFPSLVEGRAVGFYRDYPQRAADPLKVFIAAVNKAGRFINVEDDREQVMVELPKAIQKTSLLLAVLAVE
ncbi:hypothetical protein SUGI_0612000 [Cryptomeria japonica]|uniref:uncharacterized protein LOC131037351 isoform X2 n=1 Tax=Cryptomeria japonica TaxID=3369 RepID=UPI0024148BA0|nr:uncharacterized protein LOC131037351 isoform X2 [Cryptomeria japonica]GLJ30820.1 hypothetical protein SUGI_0612000 [Cryptomeria japonica]